MRVFGVLLIAIIAWGALAFGAVYPWGYWPLAIASAGLGLWGIFETHAWADPRTRQLGIAVLAIAFAIFLQIVGLPDELVGTLSPGVGHFMSEYQLGYRATGSQALSIDPRSTAIAFGLFCAFGLLLIGLVRAVRLVRLEWLLTQLMGLGVGLAILGVVQKALIDVDNPRLYGFWKPELGGNPFGPFVNRNHFAGWMVMALPLVIGYSCAVMYQSRRPASDDWRRWFSWFTTVEASRFLLVAFVVVALGMSLALTGSRSGIASFAVATAVFGAFLLTRRAARRARVFAAVYLSVLMVGAVAWAGVDRAVDRFGRATADAGGRLSAWSDTLQIVRDFPVAGTGVGTYGRAMLIYQTSGRDVMYAQAHNDYLQIASEGGLLVGIPAVAALVLVVFVVRRRLTSGDDDTLTYWTRVGAVSGLAGIAAQSIVEFSLQMPGNRVLFVVLLALALHRPARRSPDANRV
ncbi:MAG TPA: O-antigen ligase family protein [Vicinamibacterales bacterium]